MCAERDKHILRSFGETRLVLLVEGNFSWGLMCVWFMKFRLLEAKKFFDDWMIYIPGAEKNCCVYICVGP